MQGDFGAVEIEVPRDRNGSFEPKILPKHERRFDGFDDKILSMYARGMTTRDIQGHLEEIYGVEVSPSLISEVTDAVVEEVRAWQNRPLEPIYMIVYLDALIVKMRHEGRVENRAVFVAIGVNQEGPKKSWDYGPARRRAKFWLQILTEIRNRGVQDILIACVDGLKGFPEAIGTCVSEDGSAAVHRAYGSEQPGVCELERAEKGGARSAADLSGGHGRGSRRAPGGVRGTLGRQICRDRQDVATALGGHHAFVWVSGRDSAFDLHDQHRGVSAHDVAQGHQNAGFVSERRGGVETALSGAEERAEAVAGDPGLETRVEPFHAALGRPHRGRMAKAGSIAGTGPTRQNRALRAPPCYRILNKGASTALAGSHKSQTSLVRSIDIIAAPDKGVKQTHGILVSLAQR